MKAIFTITFRGESGAEVGRKSWERNFEIPLIVPGLKIKWNSFDQIELNDVHYDPKTHQYWVEYLKSVSVRDQPLKSAMEMWDEQMLNGGWIECLGEDDPAVN